MITQGKVTAEAFAALGLICMFVQYGRFIRFTEFHLREVVRTPVRTKAPRPGVGREHRTTHCHRRRIKDLSGGIGC